MSLGSITEHIMRKANTEAAAIIQQARKDAAAIIQQAHQDAKRLYQDSMDREKVFCERQKLKVTVGARLEAKKNLLFAKQELINSVFENLKSKVRKDKLKKQRVAQNKTEEVNEDIDFYLAKVRSDYETGISEILFI